LDIDLFGRERHFLAEPHSLYLYDVIFRQEGS